MYLRGGGGCPGEAERGNKYGIPVSMSQKLSETEHGQARRSAFSAGRLCSQAERPATPAPPVAVRDARFPLSRKKLPETISLIKLNKSMQASAFIASSFSSLAFYVVRNIREQ